MWFKSLKVTYKNFTYDVIVFLNDSPDNNTEVVQVRSMVNEFYIDEKIIFSSRDSAYDFITNYSQVMAKAFLIREGYSNSAFE